MSLEIDCSQSMNTKIFNRLNRQAGYATAHFSKDRYELKSGLMLLVTTRTSSILGTKDIHWIARRQEHL